MPVALATHRAEVVLGESLRDALDRYASLGFNVVSTTITVPARLTVSQLPDPNQNPIVQIRSLLAPHQLELAMVDENNGFVRRVATPAEPLPTPSIIEETPIEELLVTSHYQLYRNTTTANALERRDLQSLPSIGRDLLRSIHVIPGVATSGISARHRLRGGDDNETLYRLDGMELLTPFHLPSVQSLFSAININAIEAADVYVAGFPVSMGSRMSGVVDLIPIEATAEFSGGIDVNLVTAGMDARGKRGALNWLVSARHSLLDKTLGQFEQDYGEPKFQDQFARIVHQTDRHRFVAGFLRSTDRLTAINGGATERGRSRYQSTWLNWTAYHSERLTSDWRVNTISVDLQRSGKVDIPTFFEGQLRERRDFHTLEVENGWQWRAADWLDVHAGWSVAIQEGDFNAISEVTYGPLAAPLQNVDSLQRETRISRDGESTAAYISLNMQLSDALSLETGLRYDGQDIDPIHLNEWSTRATLDYRPSEAWQFSLNIGRYTQQQQLFEIQIDDGKADLDPPQHSDQVNVTAIWQPTYSTRWRLDLYHRDIHDPWSRFDNLYNRWILLPELRGDRVEITPRRGRVQGAEVGFEYSPSLRWSLHSSYAYGVAEEHHLGKYRDRPWQQTHTVKAGFNWQTERWRFGLSGTYRSGWPTTDFVSQASDLSAQIYQDNLPNYLSIDAHIARIVKMPRGQLEMYLDLINLTDRENVGGYDYMPPARRNAQALLPFFPTLGVMWRW